MKKLLAWLLVFVMVFSMAGCKKSTDDTEKEDAAEETTADVEEQAPVEEPRETEEEIPETVPTETQPDYTEDMEAAKLSFEEAQSIQIAQTKGVENVLLIYADRENAAENGEADTITLLTVDYNTGTLHQSALADAIYVCIPVPDDYVWGRLKDAYSMGGPALLIETVTLNFRVNIDHYMIIDSATLEMAVDLVGGVEIELSEEEKEALELDPTANGAVTLNGAQTVAYSRLEQNDDDLQKIARQQNIMGSLFKKIITVDMSALMKLAKDILPMISTDFASTSKFRIYIFKAIPSVSNATAEMVIPIELENGESKIISLEGQKCYTIDFVKNIEALHAYIGS